MPTMRIPPVGPVAVLPFTGITSICSFPFEDKKSLSYIIVPTQNDILCGKDKTYGKNPGNQTYNALIDSMAFQYKTEPSKKVKMKMTADIVYIMKTKHNSRFLKQGRNGVWEEISQADARDKVSHALRFAAATTALAGTQPTPNSPSSNKRRLPNDVHKPQSSTSPLRSRNNSLESTSSNASAATSSTVLKTNAAVASNMEPRHFAPEDIYDPINMLDDLIYRHQAVQVGRNDRVSACALPRTIVVSEMTNGAVPYGSCSSQPMDIDDDEEKDSVTFDTDDQDIDEPSFMYDTLRSADLRAIFNDPVKITDQKCELDCVLDLFR